MVIQLYVRFFLVSVAVLTSTQNPEGGKNAEAHASPRHTPELWLSTLHVFMHRHMVFFLNKIWSSSGSTYNAVSYFKRIENF